MPQTPVSQDPKFPSSKPKHPRLPSVLPTGQTAPARTPLRPPPRALSTLGSPLGLGRRRLLDLSKGSLLPWRLSSEESACNGNDAIDLGSMPGLGSSPGGGDGSPLQDSSWENTTDRGAWWAALYTVAKSWT